MLGASDRAWRACQHQPVRRRAFMACAAPQTGKSFGWQRVHRSDGGGRPKPTVTLSARDSLLWGGDMPVGAGGRTHGIRHQADVRFGHHRWPGWRLYKVQLPSGCGWAVSPFRRQLPCRANWRYRRRQEAASCGLPETRSAGPRIEHATLLDGAGEFEEPRSCSEVDDSVHLHLVR